MRIRILNPVAVLVSLYFLYPAMSARADAIIANHLTTAGFEDIPVPYIDQAKSNYKIFYGRLSHGDQIPLGMGMIMESDSLYSFNNGPGSLDMELYPSAIYLDNTESWMGATRNRLNQPDCDINIVMWSWCSDVSIADSADIAAYLDYITQLEDEYPDVTFIYMTGHADGTGMEGNLHLRNDQIRDYVIANNEVLYDFEDVESWDPDGNYHLDANEGCTWCGYWCMDHPNDCPPCDLCWHTDCFNCYLKGKAFWGLLAMLQGWDPAQTNDPVPTLSEWGMLIMALLLLAGGTAALVRKGKVAAVAEMHKPTFKK